MAVAADYFNLSLDDAVVAGNYFINVVSIYRHKFVYLYLFYPFQIDRRTILLIKE